MIEIAIAQLRFAASLIFGQPFHLRSLERIIKTLQETCKEFGMLEQEGRELLSGPVLDKKTARDLQLRRLREQAECARKNTDYYNFLFSRSTLYPARLEWEDIAFIPLTNRQLLEKNSDAFVNRLSHPSLYSLTGGTTSTPVGISFSDYEIKVGAALSAIRNLVSGEVTEEDIVQVSTSARSMLGTPNIMRSCALVGAQAYLTGITDPKTALNLLIQPRQLPGKKSKTSVLHIYPSHLGELVEEARRADLKPTNFGLERIYTGGEIVSTGLLARCREVFGPISITRSYGMTEIWPYGGQLCEAGHLHFGLTEGLVEIINPDSGKAARVGEIGVLVVTPFPPYRETTLLLRYDTGDAVIMPEETLTCSLAHLPASSDLLGKQRLALKHQDGWLYPRQVIEALEALEEVPLPARFNYRATPEGVEMTVRVRDIDYNTRHRLEQALYNAKIPLSRLQLVRGTGLIEEVYPLRADQKDFPVKLPRSYTRKRPSPVKPLAGSRR